MFPEIIEDDFGNGISTAQDITILKLNGEALHFDYVPSLSISNLKEKVKTSTGVQPENQRLVYNGKELKVRKFLTPKIFI